jgi:hypothetical protein
MSTASINMTHVAKCECCHAETTNTTLHWHAELRVALCKRCITAPSSIFVATRRTQIARGQVRRMVLAALA